MVALRFGQNEPDASAAHRRRIHRKLVGQNSERAAALQLRQKSAKCGRGDIALEGLKLFTRLQTKTFASELSFDISRIGFDGFAVVWIDLKI